MQLTALSLEDSRHGAQIEGIGHQCIQRVAGDGHYFAAAHGGGGSLQDFRLGLFDIDLNQVGSHYRCDLNVGP